MKLEIEKLKGTQKSGNHITSGASSTYASIAANKSNNTKILLVKQKGQQNDATKIKKDLQEKVSPEELGIGVTMGRTTRDGGLILSCGNVKEISTVQSAIQNKLGDNYEVDRPKTHEHRIKVVGIEESEHGAADENIVDRITKQNDLDQNAKDFKLKILRRTNVVNEKFSIVFEVDSNTYNSFISRERMNLGWNRCRVFNEYGIVRCYNCNKYGHIQKECKDKKTCAKCTGDHDVKECKEKILKCINCVESNKKYGMNLCAGHAVWDSTKCETYKRLEKMRRNKFLQ